MKSTMTRLLLAIALLLTVHGVSAQTSAAILTVNGASGTVTTGSACPAPRTSAVYKHIQAAVNCAEPGDVLLIAPGTYPEGLTIGKSLTLSGASAATTVINGGGARTVTVSGAISVTLTTLTVTGGNSTDGGGLHTASGTVRLDRVNVTGNSASGQGGGVFTGAGTVWAFRSLFSGNSAASGGALFTRAGSIRLGGGSVTANTATTGGGVFTQGGTITTETDLIAGNTAPTGAQTHTIVGQINAGAAQPFLDITVTLQGRAAAPNTALIAPLTLVLTQSGGGTVLDALVYTDVSGKVWVQAPAGTYRLSVTGPSTLRRVVDVTLTGAETAVTVPPLLAGDINQDNVITITDFSILASTFGRASGQAGFDARADFNADGAVTIADFSLLAANFGRVGES